MTFLLRDFTIARNRITLYFSLMIIAYSTTTKPGSLRTVHKIVIETEELETTRAKEVLTWAKPRIFSKFVWRQLKDCVRLGEPLQVTGGGLFE